MKIYLIRHSESVDDIENCYGGASDFELTENGKELVHDFVANIQGWNIQKIYTSPYKRALKTAQIINEKFHCELEIVEDIREMNTYGIMSGVNKDLAKDIFSYYLKKEEYKDFGYYQRKAFYGGEDPIEFDKRVNRGMNHILQESFGLEEIAIVTHGGTYRSIFKNMLDVKEEIKDIDHVAFTVLNYVNGKFAIEEKKGIYFE